jgi:pimeloyl-ACP methyl ester carboxylesterase
MNAKKPNPLLNNPLNEYLTDATQRSILFLDVLRQRGNQYHVSRARRDPNVLIFEHETILDGRSLAEPVNYSLLRILPPKGVKINENKRPFVVVDPRAGHGPGIGGFKAESEIGVAMAEGHPCYFIGFSARPEPGQTIEKIMRAEARFLEEVSKRHPGCSEKPVIIGNCQAGWAVMMLAAVYPDLCGPIIAAGSPLSYWAGVRGENPMRYTGGMLGGSWLTALTSDIGNGLFDGAWLVQNFENLNPANTLWNKQYNLYAKVDTEADRYLGFERWWDAHVFLNAEEIQYIVDNLFIGNKLSTADIVTDDKKRIDLRNIKSPIICFCSRGDNITPPQQALDWILDLYDSVDDIRDSGQTIIYAIHDHIGHLGIFVSSGIAEKEHSEFASNIDLIDCMPPGLYEAVIEKAEGDVVNPELVHGEYITRLEKRTLDDIRALGGNTPDEERCFAAVAQLSRATHGLYRTTLQPLVQALANPVMADWLHRTQPLHVSYEIFSDHNPWLKPLPSLAEKVREKRTPVAENNPFFIGQEIFSDWVTFTLNSYRDTRDLLTEQFFFAFYSNPLVQALLGLKDSDAPPRPHPGIDPGHLALLEQRQKELRSRMNQGGPREALLRALLYVNQGEETSVDERKYAMLRQIREKYHDKLPLAEFKKVIKEQFYMLKIDEKQALATLPELLAGEPAERGAEIIDIVTRISTADGTLNKDLKKRLDKVAGLLLPKNKK